MNNIQNLINMIKLEEVTLVSELEELTKLAEKKTRTSASRIRVHKAALTRLCDGIDISITPNPGRDILLTPQNFKSTLQEGDYIRFDEAPNSYITANNAYKVQLIDSADFEEECPIKIIDNDGDVDWFGSDQGPIYRVADAT